MLSANMPAIDKHQPHLLVRKLEQLHAIRHGGLVGHLQASILADAFHVGPEGRKQFDFEFHIFFAASGGCCFTVNAAQERGASGGQSHDS